MLWKPQQGSHSDENEYTLRLGCRRLLFLCSFQSSKECQPHVYLLSLDGQLVGLPASDRATQQASIGTVNSHLTDDRILRPESQRKQWDGDLQRRDP